MVPRFGAPHLDWLVVALQIQRERQRWHHEVARSVYDESHEDEGELPGFPGWEYYRHGSGICLSAPDGERLDVDFFDHPTGAVIDIWFFAARVESLARSKVWIAESRLWHWRRSREVIADGIRELVDAGVARYTTEYKNKIQLEPDFAEHTTDVAAELATPAGRERYLAVIEPGGQAAHELAHRVWLRARVAASKRPGDLLELALEGTTADEAIALCRPLLGRKDWHEGRAIELLRARRDVSLVPEIALVLRTAHPETEHPFSPYQALAYLFERGVERDLALEKFDVWSTIEQGKGHGGHPMIAELAELALEYLPDRALRVVRHGLRVGVPIAVMELSALLAAIDRRWCHRELAAAAAEQRRETHSYLAAALKSTTSELAQRRGEAVPGPAPRAPDAIGYSFDEVLHNMAGGEMDDQIDKHRPLAERLRAKYPDDWNGE